MIEVILPMYMNCPTH